MQSLWLASGGAYWIIGLAWLLGAAVFVTSAMVRAGRRGEEADGCVLAIGSVVTMSVGGGIGLQIAPFPWFILTTLGLGILFPLLLVAATRRRDRRR